MIEAAGKARSIEVFVNFMIMDINRNMLAPSDGARMELVSPAGEGNPEGSVGEVCGLHLQTSRFGEL